MAGFESRVPPGQRGMMVNQVIKNWLEEQRLIELRASIEEGFKDEENRKLYAEIDRDWAPVADEVWSQIDDDWSNMSAEEMCREFNAN